MRITTSNISQGYSIKEKRFKTCFCIYSEQSHIGTGEGHYHSAISA